MVKVLPFRGGANEYVVGNGELEVSLLDYGATIHAIRFAGRDLCLGFDDLDGYKTCTSYQGATVGRYANRIAAGKFTLDGVQYDVGRNEAGRGHLHGGKAGLNTKIWRAEPLEELPGVRFSTTLADGEEGYPGNMDISVAFSLEGGSLKISYDAVSDKDTVFNPTNHTYFRLGGENILSTELRIFAEYITPVDELLIPTGELLPVAGTPFDFTSAKPIGRDIDDPHPQIATCHGYDHNFVLGMTRSPRHAVSAYCPESGISLDCFTDMPGIQLYTSGGLSEKSGKGGVPLSKYAGFCLETQYFPDSPNRPEFPSATLRAGERFASETLYRFSSR